MMRLGWFILLLMGMSGTYTSVGAQSCSPWWTESQYQADNDQPCTVTQLLTLCNDQYDPLSIMNTYASPPCSTATNVAASGLSCCNIPGMTAASTKTNPPTPYGEMLQNTCSAYKILLSPQDYKGSMNYTYQSFEGTAQNPPQTVTSAAANAVYACNAQLAILLANVQLFPDYTESADYAGLATYMSNNLCGLNVVAAYNGCVEQLGGQVGPGDPYYVAPTSAPTPAPTPVPTPAPTPTPSPLTIAWNNLYNALNTIDSHCPKGSPYLPAAACASLFKVIDAYTSISGNSVESVICPIITSEPNSSSCALPPNVTFCDGFCTALLNQ